MSETFRERILSCPIRDQARANAPLAGLFREDRPNYRRMKDAVLAEQAMDFGERDALAEYFCHEYRASRVWASSNPSACPMAELRLSAL
jgi:hypothetical protein